MARVLILREVAAAEETAAALVAAGFEPLILPLEAYKTLDLSAGAPETARNSSGSARTRAGAGRPAPRPASNRAPTTRGSLAGDESSATFAGFLLTSLRAVPALAAFTADRSRPVFAVGERTAAAAREAGFSTVVTAGGDAPALAKAVAATGFVPGTRLLYAAGRTRTGTLEAELAGLDVELIVREAYATVRLEIERPDVEALLSGGAPDAVLILSTGQARAFCSLAERMPDLFEPKPRIAALSIRIAAALTSAWYNRAVISYEPTMVSLFERLG